MQIPSILPPIMPNALPQDVVNKAVPNVQAAQPHIQNPVTQSPKGEKSKHSHDDDQRSPGRGRKQEAKDRRDEGEEDKDHTVNIKV